jgi:hypothetical protein
MNNFTNLNSQLTLNSDSNDLISNSFTGPTENPDFFKRIKRSILTRLYNRKRDQILESSEEYIKKNHKDIYDIQLEAREDGGLSSPFQFVRLKEIDELIEEFNIKSVCEFGSGSSSAIFAKRINNKDDFHTFEENEFWYKKMLDSMGKYKDLMNAHLRERKVSLVEGESVTFHDDVPLREFDLLYIDGPTSSAKENETDLKILDPHKTMPNINFELFWNNKIFPKVIVIDGRRSTLRRAFQKKLDNYVFYPKTDYLVPHNLNIKGEYLYHSVLVRKDLI